MNFKSDKQRKLFGFLKSHPNEAKLKGFKPLEEGTPKSPASPGVKFQMLRRKLSNG